MRKKNKNNQNIISYTLIFSIILIATSGVLAKIFNLDDIFYYMIIGALAILLSIGVVVFVLSFKNQDDSENESNNDLDTYDKYIYYIASYIGVVMVSFLIIYLVTIGMSIFADTISQSDTKMGKYLFYGFPAMLLLIAGIVMTIIFGNLAVKKTSLLKYMFCSCIFAGIAVLIYLLVGIFCF